MRNIRYNAPILVGNTWFNIDGTTERAQEFSAQFKASDYAKAVELNNKIMAALFCALVIAGTASQVL